MSGIFGLSKNATTPTVYNSIQLQSSSQAIAVPVYYGTNRGAPNLLWYGGFRKTQVQSSGKGGIGSVSAGKGGGSGQFNYFADVILGVSEGPVQGFGQAWASKTPTTLASLGMTSFLGTYPQTAWSYVTGAYPTEARPYTGLAYLAASGYQLGSAAELPAHTFEVYGFFSQRTVYETGTIPGSGARTITVARRAWANGSTVSLWVSDGNSVVDSNGNVFAKVVGAPGAGQYSVLLGVYTFNAADAGKSVTIAYTGKGQDADPSLIVPDILSNANYGCGFPSAHVGELTAYSEDFVIPGGLSVAVAHAAGFDDNLSVYQAAADQLFTCVASGPGPLQYSYLAGVYTFNAADIGKTVSIAYAALGGLTTYQQYCWANGFFISPVYRSLTTGAAALDEIGKLTNSEVVFSAGALKLVPRGDQTITANGYTYTAPSATVADFTDDQFLNGNQGGGASGQAANDPVILTRKRQSDQRNVVSIECLDRANQYNSAVVEATDQAQVDLYGRRSTGGQQAHIFCVPTIAKQSCQLLLQREAIRNQYAFTLDARWVWLDPMDVISVTDTRLGLSTSDWLRIVSIDEQGNGDLAVIAEEYLTGISSAQAYTFGTGTGYAANYQADPGSVNTPIVFEPTVQLATNTGLEIWCAVSGANPNWGGCDIYVSSDNVTYNFVGRKWGNSRMGTLVGSPILNGTPNFPRPEQPGRAEDAPSRQRAALLPGPRPVGLRRGVRFGPALRLAAAGHVGRPGRRDADGSARRQQRLGRFLLRLRGCIAAGRFRPDDDLRLDDAQFAGDLPRHRQDAAGHLRAIQFGAAARPGHHRHAHRRPYRIVRGARLGDSRRRRRRQHALHRRFRADLVLDRRPHRHLHLQPHRLCAQSPVRHDPGRAFAGRPLRSPRRQHLHLPL
jgi:hypothetical protein